MTILNMVFSEMYDSRREYYAHWMSVMSLFPSEEYYGFDLYNQRIFDLILPGSHHSGMYETAIRSKLQPSTDSYFAAISYLNDSNKFVKWSTRQRSSIYNQLLAGCRYFDIRLEKYQSEYYAHHGMLGASLTVIIEDITKYIKITEGELIILSFSEFININSIDLDRIYNQIMVHIGEYMADSKSHRYDISKDNIGHLIKTNGVRVIAFIDKQHELVSNEGKYDHYFYDSQKYLVGDDELRIKPRGKKQKKGKGKNKNKNSNDIEEEEEENNEPLTTQTIISNTLLQITKGWDKNKLNQIFWDINIEYPSQINKYTEIYDSFLMIHIEFISTLKTAINEYPKVYFGNIIIIDFVEYLSMDFIIILIMNYNKCFDKEWGNKYNDCPKLTKLSKSFKTNDISPSCQHSIDLQSICPRSCGLCNKWISNVPNTACNSSSQCDGPIYRSTQQLYDNDATSICHFVDNTASWNDKHSEEESIGFCLSPFPQISCGIVDFLVTDVADYNVKDCNSPCNEDYQCLSGYCSSRDGVCLTINTPSPTPHPTPLQCYCDHIHSDAAIELIEYIGPFRNYENCPSLTNCVNDEFYMQSLISFGIIPIIIGSVLLGIYFCCCLLFCAWSEWSKYTFCRCLDGMNSKHWWFKWIFAILLFIILAIITWQCIEGLQANTEMHDHLFDTEETQSISFKGEILSILDTATARFANVGDETKYIASTMAIALEEISKTIKSTNFDIDINVDPIYKALTYIATEYDDYELTATIIDPQTLQPQEIVLVCDFCADITEYVIQINTSLAEAVSTVKEIEAMINQYTTLIASEVDIGVALLTFGDATTNFTGFIDIYRVYAGYAMDVFEVLDEQREYVGTGIFVAPLFWITLFSLALAAFALIAWISHCSWISECFFRFTWCCMMFVGSVMMIIFGCLIVLNVGWADFCVYLDHFESDPIKNSPSSFADGAKLVNACWSGENLFDTFNLTQIQQFSEYENNISITFNIDLLKSLEIIELDLFTAEIELLDIDEFHTEGDLYLSHLNQIGPPCTCNCLPWGTEQGTFTRSKFQSGQCFDKIDCWTDITQFLDISKLSQSLGSNLPDLNELNANIPDLNELSAGLPNINDLLLYTQQNIDILQQQNIIPNIDVFNAPNIPDIDVEVDMNFAVDVNINNLEEIESSLNEINIGGYSIEELNYLFQVNRNIPSDYDPSECIEYISQSYGYVMAEYILYNETISFINQLKDEVYNISQSYNSVFMIGITIENVLGNITRLISPLLQRFNIMMDDYARCGFLGEIYGGFKQVSCVCIFEDMYQITWSIMIISFLSIIAVLLALCLQYLFHPVRKFVTYRTIYGDHDDDEGEDEIIVCPKCHYQFPLSQAIHPHIISDEEEEEKEEKEEKEIIEEIEIADQSSIVFGAAQLNDNWNEYKSMLKLVFYTFAGYLPWSKYVGLYMSIKELQRFLDIVCITDPVEDVFDLIDTDINDGRLTFTQFMEYFTDKTVNPLCGKIKYHIENQVTWQLLCKSLKIFESMDANHSGKLEYNEFANFGKCIGLNPTETEILWNTMDTNKSGAIDIIELFEWLRLRLDQQKGRIITKHEATIRFNRSDLEDLEDFKTAQSINTDDDDDDDNDDDGDGDEDRLRNINVDSLYGQLQSSNRNVTINNHDDDDNDDDDNKHDLP